jgi:CheY-like chemotaxis protein
MPTLGDVFRVYVKPSLDGLMVVRKRNTRQKSAAVAASKARVADAPRIIGDYPARIAHENLVRADKCPTQYVYEPGKGYVAKPVCPAKLMKAELRKVMTELHRKGGARSMKPTAPPAAATEEYFAPPPLRGRE